MSSDEKRGSTQVEMEHSLTVVESGMESSRGGPLTTFIMMLPLIVVPTIAMLRPAGTDGSMLSDLLSASSSEEAASDPSEFADAVFSEIPETDPGLSFDSAGRSDEFAELDAQLFAEASGDPATSAFASSPDMSDAPTFREMPSQRNRVPDASVPHSDLPQTSQLLTRLQQMGARRTLWFDPGNGQFGFVAFFQAGSGIIRYRFESIAASESAAVQDVMAQASAWQAESNR